MPRRTEKHRDVTIVITPEAANEALAMWIDLYHDSKVDPSSIVIDLDPATNRIREVRAVKKAEKTPKKPAKKNAVEAPPNDVPTKAG